ncbi:SdpI family protein [bacterium]|uniref:SdpI family protein n=1 Tax=unclassified Bariatricus TaxID=2677046 RepID=UPI002A87A1DB|nr:SdpI family protein [bacterium]MDD7143673.1 SdpI family protein [bacterium]MDY4194175.1 SdpI family protein [Bariatricus sp.]MDY5458134.1 SdpI family protein [Bariatricus sp.]
MKKNKTLILTTLLCLLPMIFSAAVYTRLPEQMAIHWGPNNEPNGYAPRLIGAFGLPLLMAVLNIVVHVGLDHDPRNNNSAPAIKLLGKWCIPVLSLIMVPASLLINMGHELPIDKIAMIMVGIIFTICGNYLPKCRQNYTIGIKIPWTLASEENWNKTHHLAGYLWIIGGILMIFFGLFGFPILTVLLLIPLAVVPMIFSFVLYKKGD